VEEKINLEAKVVVEDSLQDLKTNLANEEENRRYLLDRLDECEKAILVLDYILFIYYHFFF
jgi:endo-alpha-1,4-polygalactosaminidase (GH114 family)